MVDADGRRKKGGGAISVARVIVLGAITALLPTSLPAKRIEGAGSDLPRRGEAWFGLAGSPLSRRSARPTQQPSRSMEAMPWSGHRHTWSDYLVRVVEPVLENSRHGELTMPARQAGLSVVLPTRSTTGGVSLL